MKIHGDPPSVHAGDRVLVIGLGNDLRSDDGAGPRVVAALQGTPWQTLTTAVLTPDLADVVAATEWLLVVDAHVDPRLAEPTWLEAEPAAPGLFGHALDVAGLLRLTRILHARTPQVAVLALPARDFALGERASPITYAAERAALAHLQALALAAQSATVDA
jgi:hydrogenase maturation protease